MINEPINFAKSAVGLSVLALFSVAVVAGQAEANLPVDAAADAAFDQIQETHIVYDLKHLQEVQGLRRAMETFLGLSGRVELTLDLLVDPQDSNEDFAIPLHD